MPVNIKPKDIRNCSGLTKKIDEFCLLKSIFYSKIEGKTPQLAKLCQNDVIITSAITWRLRIFVAWFY